jgi:hypothetical protein
MEGVTLILDVVKPVLHKYVPPPVAVKVVLVPAHIATLLPASATGIGLTVTNTLELELHPLDVAVTLYVVVKIGLTTILAVVAPVLHKYVVPPVAVNVVDKPLQIVTGLPALATGIGLTTTTTLSVAVQPVFVTVTV